MRGECDGEGDDETKSKKWINLVKILHVHYIISYIIGKATANNNGEITDDTNGSLLLYIILLYSDAFAEGPSCGDRLNTIMINSARRFAHE